MAEGEDGGTMWGKEVYRREREARESERRALGGGGGGREREMRRGREGIFVSSPRLQIVRFQIAITLPRSVPQPRHSHSFFGRSATGSRRSPSREVRVAIKKNVLWILVMPLMVSMALSL